MPLELEGSRSLTNITLVLVLSAKSAFTKRSQSLMPFQCLAMEVLQDLNKIGSFPCHDANRFQSTSLLAMQESVEAFSVGLFEDANLQSMPRRSQSCQKTCRFCYESEANLTS